MTKTGDSMDTMRRRVGWFVMLGMGVIVLLLLVASIRTDVFASKFTLYVQPPSATAFFVGQAVKFQGFTIGRVSDITLQPQGEVRIALHLLERYRGMLHQGSAVRLVKPGLLGQETVELTGGDIHSVALADGSLMPFREQATLEALLMDMKPAVANADALLGELVRAAKWLNDPNGDIRLATANIRTVTEGVEQGAIQHAVARVSGAAVQFEKLSRQLADNNAGEHLAHSLQQTAQVLKNIEPLTGELGRQAPAALARSRVLMQRLDELTRSLNDIAADMQQVTPALPGLAEESRNAMLEMRRLAGAVRNSWLGGGRGEALPTSNEAVAPPALVSMP
ncbi:MAG: MlaD family protein [Mariprofundaceae bacterium]|nr:MlaD family protein [Mariprofundaceae bacterium]